jgi:hypothetical protein
MTEDLQSLQRQEVAEYEEPLLLDAQDLYDVAGGCLFDCHDGTCKS